MNKLNKFIGLNFKKSSGGDGRIYEYFYDNAIINMEFDNCVFLNSTFTSSFETTIYTGNSNGGNVNKLEYNNCSFLQSMSLINTSIHNCNKNTFLNCAFSGSNLISKTTNLNNINFDSNYNITSGGWKNTGTGVNPDGTEANIGVYGGKFAWGNWSSTDESITLDKSSMNLNENESQQLKATTTPAGTQVTWKSSDSSIATVDSNGKVIGVKEGTCTITATTPDGLTASCTVTVTKESTPNNSGTTTDNQCRDITNSYGILNMNTPSGFTQNNNNGGNNNSSNNSGNTNNSGNSGNNYSNNNNSNSNNNYYYYNNYYISYNTKA